MLDWTYKNSLFQRPRYDLDPIPKLKTFFTENTDFEFQLKFKTWNNLIQRFSTFYQLRTSGMFPMGPVYQVEIQVILRFLAFATGGTRFSFTEMKQPVRSGQKLRWFRIKYLLIIKWKFQYMNKFERKIQTGRCQHFGWWCLKS